LQQYLPSAPFVTPLHQRYTLGDGVPRSGPPVHCNQTVNTPMRESAVVHGAPVGGSGMNHASEHPHSAAASTSPSHGAAAASPVPATAVKTITANFTIHWAEEAKGPYSAVNASILHWPTDWDYGAKGNWNPSPYQHPNGTVYLMAHTSWKAFCGETIIKADHWYGISVFSFYFSLFTLVCITPHHYHPILSMHHPFHCRPFSVRRVPPHHLYHSFSPCFIRDPSHCRPFSLPCIPLDWCHCVPGADRTRLSRPISFPAGVEARARWKTRSCGLMDVGIGMRSTTPCMWGQGGMPILLMALLGRMLVGPTRQNDLWSVVGLSSIMRNDQSCCLLPMVLRRRICTLVVTKDLGSRL
jgi:hypothetical protein